MRMWRYEIINLFRDAYKNNKLVLTNAIKEMLNPTFTFAASHGSQRLRRVDRGSQRCIG